MKMTTDDRSTYWQNWYNLHEAAYCVTVISYSIIMILLSTEIIQLQQLYLPVTLIEEHKVKEFKKRKC
jgi:hypothetical protein